VTAGHNNTRAFPGRGQPSPARFLSARR
jgi:hypothetical protein